MECLYAIGVPGFTIRNSTLPRLRDHGPVLHLRQLVDARNRPPTATSRSRTTSSPTPRGRRRRAGTTTASTSPTSGLTARRDPMSGWIGPQQHLREPRLHRARSGHRRHAVGRATSAGGTAAPASTFRSNVGKTCSRQDKAVSPPAQHRTTTARVRLGRPGTYDFRLKAGSPAINAGEAGDAPAARPRRPGARRQARCRCVRVRRDGRPASARGPRRAPRRPAAGAGCGIRFARSEPADDLPPGPARMPDVSGAAAARDLRAERGPRARPALAQGPQRPTGAALRSAGSRARTQADPRAAACAAGATACRDRARRGGLRSTHGVLKLRVR